MSLFLLTIFPFQLEKVVGYEQRRRIRAQIRVAKKMVETELTHNNTYTKTTKQVHLTKTRSPDRHSQAKTPEPKSTAQRTTSPERHPKSTVQITSSLDRQVKLTPKSDRVQTQETVLLNGHAKDSTKVLREVTHMRTQSPEKSTSRVTKTKSPVRHPSPEKKTRTTSPSKTVTPKPKSNRFNEYATAYMKKAGLNDTDKLTVTKTRKGNDITERKIEKQVEEHKVTESKLASQVSKTHIEKTSSKEVIEVVHLNGKRSPSPEKKRSPERQQIPTERLREKSPSPVLKRQLSDTGKKETIIKTVFDIGKKVQPKASQEEKPSWVMNRNLKKISSETRTFSSKKIESEKPKYRAPSPSKAISKPLDVITSSYGPGPLDADGKPLFGIKALRNGASNYQGNHLLFTIAPFNTYITSRKTSDLTISSEARQILRM